MSKSDYNDRNSFTYRDDDIFYDESEIFHEMESEKEEELFDDDASDNELLYSSRDYDGWNS